MIARILIGTMIVLGLCIFHMGIPKGVIFGLGLIVGALITSLAASWMEYELNKGQKENETRE